MFARDASATLLVLRAERPEKPPVVEQVERAARSLSEAKQLLEWGGVAG
jgi:hypothetical protein